MPPLLHATSRAHAVARHCRASSTVPPMRAPRRIREHAPKPAMGHPNLAAPSPNLTSIGAIAESDLYRRFNPSAAGLRAPPGAATSLRAPLPPPGSRRVAIGRSWTQGAGAVPRPCCRLREDRRRPDLALVPCHTHVVDATPPRLPPVGPSAPPRRARAEDREGPPAAVLAPSRLCRRPPPGRGGEIIRELSPSQI
uniref:Uncharacterized protein n=1 Tax=Oryza brachyantha TaxID=4533 RepID=J3LPR2_ORYBR